eukprot:gb/GFBE01058957.1/.p3 GENE.gb/GFBE01058957.1/~~gb/GFBE01058957.1/.p3  ORF type:complete len:101 (-),score=11.73 gb/GFBE01058957.1/:130-432(-)
MLFGGCAWQRHGLTDSRLYHLQEAIRHDPLSADVCHQLGVALATAGTHIQDCHTPDELLARAARLRPWAADFWDDWRRWREEAHGRGANMPMRTTMISGE